MSRAGIAFSVTSLVPLPLIVAAALWGGMWPWLALGYITLFAFAMDELVARAAGPERAGSEFPAADALSVVLAGGHFAVLGLAVWAVSGGDLGTGAAVALFLAAGLFLGQIGNSNAHELIHRAARPLFQLGRWSYISLLFGHHASAHPLVHHVHVGTARDPNSARRGEGYYRLALRAWLGSFRDGLTVETARWRRRGGVHAYAVYVAGAVAAVGASFWIGGSAGVAVHLGLAGFAQSQLLISDYVQHYGLRRAQRADGSVEPVGPQHSWNAPHWFTGHMMLNAPRHSDQHANPARAFPELRLEPGTMPMLPRPLPVMAAIALVPPLWRRMMDPRAARWQGGMAPAGETAQGRDPALGSA